MGGFSQPFPVIKFMELGGFPPVYDTGICGIDTGIVMIHPVYGVMNASPMRPSGKLT